MPLRRFCLTCENLFEIFAQIAGENQRRNPRYQVRKTGRDYGPHIVAQNPNLMEKGEAYGREERPLELYEHWVRVVTGRGTHGQVQVNKGCCAAYQVNDR